MNLLDWVVLLGALLGIAAYGTWRTRHTDHLRDYLKGNRDTGWMTIGLSIMATQASTITYLSLPGQAYESGIAFIQNYFGLPLALIIVSAVFLPIYRRLDVYTAYEYLGQRFDSKTRLLGAGLFLLQRGVQSGITVYVPAIILSSVLGWQLNLTIIFTGLVVIIYTVTGGSAAVSLTQKWQMAVIFCGMLTAFGILLAKLPSGAMAMAGAMGKLQAVDFSIDPNKRYTFWSGLLGGLFLSLSYFGTDQSQVQRYIGGAGLREGRLGLMFNAALKIPMQFLILLMGALLFVYFQLQPNTPIFFNRVEWQRHVQGTNAAPFRALKEKHAALHLAKQEKVTAWLTARQTKNPTTLAAAKTEMLAAQQAVDGVRKEARDAMLAANPKAKVKDSDYIFITFIMSQLPHGVIGLLLAVMFASTLSSKAGELNALASTTTIDLWRQFRPLAAHDEARNVRAAKWFTAFWGVFAMGFALFASFAENLIEALNIIASVFYGVLLGVFLVAFFCKRVGGTAVFVSALIAQTLVIVMYFNLNIGYLWYNVIGCAACILFSLILQATLRSPRPAHAMNQPIIAFGQQPCGFFPKRFLVAKIFTARRLQSEIGGEIVFFYHDSDHDPRETRTILRHRKTNEEAVLNFAVENKIQRKFSPLFLKKIAGGWLTQTILQLPNYVDPYFFQKLGDVSAVNVADFCLQMYRLMGLLENVRVVRSSDPALRTAACAIDDYFVDVPYQSEIVRAHYAGNFLRLHEGGNSFIDLRVTEFSKSQITPARDTRLRWMQSVLHCTHYIAGAGEQAYLRKEDAPEITFVARDAIDRSDEAYVDLPN